MLGLVCHSSIDESDAVNHYKSDRHRFDSLPYIPQSSKRGNPSLQNEKGLLEGLAQVYKTCAKLKSRHAKRKVQPASNGIWYLKLECPICNSTLPNDIEHVNTHIDSCLKSAALEPQQESTTNWTEYEWGGITRVRASALLEGGLSSSFHPSQKDNEEDEELVVDFDDEFGPAQFDESYVQAHVLTIPNNDSREEIQGIAIEHPEGLASPESLIIAALKAKLMEFVPTIPYLDILCYCFQVFSMSGSL